MTVKSTEYNAILRETFGLKSRYGTGERNVKVLLGVDPDKKWPVEGIGMRVVNGWKVWVDPLVGEVKRNGWRSFRRGTHRAKAECPTCGQQMSAGRVHQHVCKGVK